jgi:hypothetical protein
LTDGPSLTQKIVVVHRALAAAALDHAFGGALALAWCTHRPRGTVDIDLNVFVGVEGTDRVLDALAPHVAADDSSRQLLAADGQARLWFDRTPVDVFLDTTPFHREVGDRIRWQPFGGDELPFLACTDLAVFKAFYDRTRDWADLEEMVAARSLDVDAALGVLTRYLGGGDHRIERLRALAGPP